MRRACYISFISLLLLVGCGDWLREEPRRVDSDGFMRNAAEVRGVVNSIYYELERDAAFGRYLVVVPESLSDYCYGRGNYASTYSEGLTSGAAGFVKDTWAVLYRAVRFANQVMKGMEEASLTAEEYSALSAETRFLRALCYSYLVRYWGAVPFYDESCMEGFDRPRRAADEIWEYVAGELRDVAPDLPETAAGGRPTRYAALALLCEASLYTGRWEEAETAAREVIASGRYSLVSVGAPDDFLKVFGHRVNLSPEEIFYIKFNRYAGSSFAWMYLAKPYAPTNMGALGIYTDSVRNRAVAGWDRADMRYGFALYAQTGNGTLNSLTRSGMICTKFRDTEWTSGSSTANDMPLIRYADLLLWHAEAACRAAGAPTAAALESLNAVRRRAYGYDPAQPSAADFTPEECPTTEAFIDLVVRERGYELCFEGKRYCDLKRLGRLASAAAQAGRVASEAEVGEAAWWWPLPTDEFNYNGALDPVKDQNPGY